jgi:hypothetical protein
VAACACVRMLCCSVGWTYACMHPCPLSTVLCRRRCSGSSVLRPLSSSPCPSRQFTFSLAVIFVVFRRRVVVVAARRTRRRTRYLTNHQPLQPLRTTPAGTWEVENKEPKGNNQHPLTHYPRSHYLHPPLPLLKFGPAALGFSWLLACVTLSHLHCFHFHLHCTLLSVVVHFIFLYSPNPCLCLRL